MFTHCLLDLDLILSMQQQSGILKLLQHDLWNTRRYKYFCTGWTTYTVRDAREEISYYYYLHTESRKRAFHWYIAKLVTSNDPERRSEIIYSGLKYRTARPLQIQV